MPEAMLSWSKTDQWKRQKTGPETAKQQLHWFEVFDQKIQTAANCIFIKSFISGLKTEESLQNHMALASPVFFLFLDKLKMRQNYVNWESTLRQENLSRQRQIQIMKKQHYEWTTGLKFTHRRYAWVNEDVHQTFDGNALKTFRRLWGG